MSGARARILLVAAIVALYACLGWFLIQPDPKAPEDDCQSAERPSLLCDGARP